MRNPFVASALLLILGSCQSALVCPESPIGSVLSNEKYGIEVVCGRDHYRVRLQEFIRYEGQQAVWKPLAEETISARPGEVILSAECEGPPFDFIVLAHLETAELRRAWRINLDTFRFEPIPLTGIHCAIEKY